MVSYVKIESIYLSAYVMHVQTVRLACHTRGRSVGHLSHRVDCLPLSDSHLHLRVGCLALSVCRDLVVLLVSLRATAPLPRREY